MLAPGIFQFFDMPMRMALFLFSTNLNTGCLTDPHETLTSILRVARAFCGQNTGSDDFLLLLLDSKVKMLAMYIYIM